MKSSAYAQKFPALSRYLLRFADGGRFRTSLSAVQSAARDVGELPASLRGAAFRQIAYAPARETQKYRIFAEKRIPMKQPDHRPWKVLNSEYLAHEPWFTVRRELYEETGYGGGEWKEYMVLSANPATHTNLTYTFLATGVQPLSTQHLEASEDIRIHLFTFEEVRRLLEENCIPQALMAAPLWRYVAEHSERR